MLNQIISKYELRQSKPIEVMQAKETKEPIITTIDLSAELLADSLTCDNFLRNLREAADITYTTFNEAGFSVYINRLQRTIIVGSVGEGDNYSMRPENFDPGKKVESDHPDGIRTFDIHFHPWLTGPAVPSDSDLGLVRFSRVDEDATLRPIFAVGKVRKNHGIEIILFQEKRTLLDTQIERACERIEYFLSERNITSREEFTSRSSIKSTEISSLLEESGYNSLVLIYPPSIGNENGRKLFRNKNKGRLSKVLSKFSQLIEVKPISPID